MAGARRRQKPSGTGVFCSKTPWSTTARRGCTSAQCAQLSARNAACLSWNSKAFPPLLCHTSSVDRGVVRRCGLNFAAHCGSFHLSGLRGKAWLVDRCQIVGDLTRTRKREPPRFKLPFLFLLHNLSLVGFKRVSPVGIVWLRMVRLLALLARLHPAPVGIVWLRMRLLFYV